MIKCGCVEGSCRSEGIHNQKVLGRAIKAHSRVNWEAVKIVCAAAIIIKELEKVGIVVK